MKKNRYCLAIYLPSLAGVLIAILAIVLQLYRIKTNQYLSIETDSICLCIAIIALAVATWVGLSISNAVERQTVADIEEKQLEIEQWILSQKRLSQSTFIDELRKHSANPLINKLQEEFVQIPETESIDYISLTELAQNMIYISELHEKCHSNEEVCNAINNVKQILERVNADSKNNSNRIVCSYLAYCRAIMEYHLGYHDDQNQKQHFEAFIQQCEKFADSLKLKLIKSFPDEPITTFFSRAKEEHPDESLAYLYNILGDAYRFVDTSNAPLRAATYCSHACQLSKNWEYPKNKYLRNLGCAVERLLSTKEGLDDYSFKQLKQNYEDALKSSHPSSKDYKVILSLLDKQLNRKLNIQYDNATKRKKTSYNTQEFIEKWKAVSSLHGEIDDLLKEMKKYADQAKQLFHQDPVGYQYKAVYYWHQSALATVDSEYIKRIYPDRDAAYYCRKAVREKEIVDHLTKEDRVVELSKFS